MAPCNDRAPPSESIGPNLALCAAPRMRPAVCDRKAALTMFDRRPAGISAQPSIVIAAAVLRFAGEGAVATAKWVQTRAKPRPFQGIRRLPGGRRRVLRPH
jgi:hypothetical protein